MALDQIPESPEEEMGFLDHLEELRWHLVRAVASVLVFTIVAFLFKDFIFDVLILGPTESDFWTYRKLCELSSLLDTPALCLEPFEMDIQNRNITGQFVWHIKSSLVVGLVIAFPYAFWEIWRFVKPGLRSNEKKASRGVVFVVTILFLSGVVFGYFIVTPLSFNFLQNYTLSPKIDNDYDLSNIIGMVATLALACGVMFQLPVVTYILSKAGIVTPKLMRSYRRHSFVVILVISAIITPPDVMSQVLIALPLTFLYEVSILVSKRIERKRIKREQEEAL
ncbi:twin-arginine translocase subunit TatC [Roseivirga misakiensis]|uniref:Sec-independent protein translocase protein TatC n=1 Tax=Roseivirga misakiensis TaxID=1563681 RepID=A0A1E5T6P3_9BACT|nr:twin-arginine translocase subunit TatC [Roseivirga misakiensis]OEK07052.1 twin arginine-targeting protein translocase TatC [Roseivirga misakiensis]